MPSSLAPGVSINMKTRCLVRSKPKDLDRHEEQHEASIRKIGPGLFIPFTNWQNIPEEDPLPANGPPQQPQRRSQSRTHDSQRDGGPPQQSQRSGGSQARQGGGSRQSQGQASQVSRPRDRIIVEGGIESQPPSHRRSSHQSGQRSQGSRHSHRESLAKQRTDLQAPDPENRNFSVREAEEREGRSTAGRPVSAQPGTHPQYQFIQPRVATLRNEAERSSRHSHSSRRSGESARQDQQPGGETYSRSSRHYREDLRHSQQQGSYDVDPEAGNPVVRATRTSSDASGRSRR